MKLDTYFSKFIDDLKLNAQKPAIIENNISYSYEKLHEKISFYIEELESKNIQNKVIYLLSDYSFNAISLFLHASISILSKPTPYFAIIFKLGSLSNNSGVIVSSPTIIPSASL